MNNWQRFLAQLVGLSFVIYLIRYLLYRVLIDNRSNLNRYIDEQTPIALFNHWMVIKVSLIISLGILVILKIKKHLK
jgi:uncharacterized protein with PQ loop repeat